MLTIWRRLLLAVLITLYITPAAGDNHIAEFLPPEIERLIKKHRLKKKHIGLIVQNTNGTVLAAHQTQRSFNPASVIKIVTAFAAIDLLGPEFKWQTKLAKTGVIDKDGTLQGDLYLIGSGDPYLTAPEFFYLLNELRSSGIKHIAGKVIIDDSIYMTPPHDPSAFDGAGTRAYNTGPGGLVVNFKSQRVVFVPRDGGITVYTDPPNLNFQLDNRVRSGKVRCRNWRGKIRERLLGDETRITLRLSGRYSPRCRKQSFHLSVLSHPAYVAGVFGGFWQKLGGSWSGQWENAKAPDKIDTLLTHTSQPLAQILTGMNKFSNNLIARNVYLALATAGEQPPPYTPAQAQQIMRYWLENKGVPDIIVDNGSGLSRRSRITPADMNHLLLSIWNHPYRAEIISSLPIIGKDGTLRKRMKKTPLVGEGHLKTGSLAGITTLSGFFRAANGDYLMLTLFSEKQVSGYVRRLQADIMKWAYNAEVN